LQLAKTEAQNGLLILEYLSDIELYYSPLVQGDKILIGGEEMNHLIRVMRHKEGDIIHITDGSGKIFKGEITDVVKEYLSVSILFTYQYKNAFKNIYFCLPKLKNPERFEFALEKCTELGITNFVVYDPVRGLKKGDKKDRWERITLSAMKQSLRSFKPEINYLGPLSALKDSEGKKIIFDQNAAEYFHKDVLIPDEVTYFIFGPEGGFDEKELLSLKNSFSYKIADNRLRSETAIIKAAASLD
jgi:16S rRNA (uracil1498-N3)-methyltransferase